MAWNGYFTYNGSEIINVQRFETYMYGARVPWFRAAFGTTAITEITGEDYLDPEQDPAPWVDPDNPATYRFWGVYPLNITGISDSSRTAEITENLGDGAYVGPLRAASKSAVFEVMLAGADEQATEAGFNWLRTALSQGACGDDSDFNGGDLCYMAAEPCTHPNCYAYPMTYGTCVTQIERVARTLRDVKIVSGPRVSSQRTASDGAVIWTATFTAVAGVPFEFGQEIELVEGFGVATDPWVPTIVPADWAFNADSPDEVEDVDCAIPVYEPIVDPLCPAIETPPAPPSIPIGCWKSPETWDRRWFTIPRKYVPYWGDVVPVIKIQTGPTEARGMRLRFYADFEANASVLEDPCGFCGDILVSYVPPNHTFTLDGVSEIVVAEGAGGLRQRADSLVFKTDGTPFDWPVLSCGLGYVVAVDFPTGQNNFVMPAIDLALVPRGGM